MLRTGTLALTAVIAALFMGGASAHAAAEVPPTYDSLVDALVLSGRSGDLDGSNVEAPNWEQNGR